MKVLTNRSKHFMMVELSAPGLYWVFCWLAWHYFHCKWTKKPIQMCWPHPCLSLVAHFCLQKAPANLWLAQLFCEIAINGQQQTYFWTTEKLWDVGSDSGSETSLKNDRAEHVSMSEKGWDIALRAAVWKSTRTLIQILLRREQLRCDLQST